MRHNIHTAQGMAVKQQRCFVSLSKTKIREDYLKVPHYHTQGEYKGISFSYF